MEGPSRSPCSEGDLSWPVHLLDVPRHLALSNALVVAVGALRTVRLSVLVDVLGGVQKPQRFQHIVTGVARLCETVRVDDARGRTVCQVSTATARTT